MALVLQREEIKIDDLANMTGTITVTYLDTTTNLTTNVVIDSQDFTDITEAALKAAINAEVPGLIP